MASTINDSLQQLQNTVEVNKASIEAFKTEKDRFHSYLLDQLKDILIKLQSIANNSQLNNINALSETQQLLANTQQQMQEAQQQLQACNAENTRLNTEIQRITNELANSTGENSQLQNRLATTQQALDATNQEQADIIRKIGQVNDLLTQQAADMNATIASAQTYNGQYETEINSIQTTIQNVLNLLNGSSGSGRPPGNNVRFPQRPPQRPNRGGNITKKNRKTKKYLKGGWIYNTPSKKISASNKLSSSSSSSNSSSTKRKRSKAK